MPILDERMLDFISHSPDQTRRYGVRLGRLFQAGDIVGLQGELGTGKTCLAQGVGEGMGRALPLFHEPRDIEIVKALARDLLARTPLTECRNEQVAFRGERFLTLERHHRYEVSNGHESGYKPRCGTERRKTSRHSQPRSFGVKHRFYITFFIKIPQAR